jgi:presenilin-like A22 family membrane protease
MPAVAALCVIFAACILGGMAVSGLYPADYRAFGQETENPLNSVYYILLILGFTGGILYAVKKGGQKAIKALFLGITGFTVYYVVAPVLAQFIIVDAAIGVSLEIAVVMTLLLWKFPEWYVIDAAGVLMCIGLSAILGLSFGILPALLLLIMLAVYDFIAVYKTKHMIALADTVMTESLPIMFVLPKHWGYSFLIKRRSLKQQIASGERRDALFMGFGDVVIPGALVVSAYYWLPWEPTFAGTGGNLALALITLVGGVIGFTLLMRAVLKGNPQAGLPLLNGGTITAFIVGSFVIYGSLPF